MQTAQRSETQISIHALREEGDRTVVDGWIRAGSISIHALREEGDPRSSTGMAPSGKFLSTPSARRATCRCRRLWNLL